MECNIRKCENIVFYFVEAVQEEQDILQSIKNKEIDSL